MFSAALEYFFKQLFDFEWDSIINQKVSSISTRAYPFSEIQQEPSITNVQIWKFRFVHLNFLR